MTRLLGALGVAFLYHLIAWIGYAITRSGVKIDYILPLTVKQEVALGLSSLFLSGVALFCLLITLVVWSLSGNLLLASMIAAFTALTLCLMSRDRGVRRFERDVASVRRRRLSRSKHS